MHSCFEQVAYHLLNGAKQEPYSESDYQSLSYDLIWVSILSSRGNSYRNVSIKLISKMVSIRRGPASDGRQACSTSLYMVFRQMAGMQTSSCHSTGNCNGHVHQG